MRKIEENSKRKTRNISKLINPSHLKKTRTFQFSSNSTNFNTKTTNTLTSSFSSNYIPLSPQEKVISFNDIKFKSNQRLKRYSDLLGRIKEEIGEINIGIIKRIDSLTDKMNNSFDHGDSTINPKLVDENLENIIIITNSKPFQIKKCNGKKAAFKSSSLFNLKKLRCKTLLYKKKSTIKNKEIIQNAENANISVVSSHSSNNKTIYNNDSVKYTSNICYICSSLGTNNIRNNDYCTIY